MGQEESRQKGGRSAEPEPEPELHLPSVCRQFNSAAGCHNTGCDQLHVCYYSLATACRYQDKCTKPHLLGTVHNSAVLGRLGWQPDEFPLVKRLLERQLRLPGGQHKSGGPLVCYQYQQRACSDPACPSLHICLHHVRDACRYGPGCRLNHDLCGDEHNLHVLKLAGLVDTPTEVLFSRLRELYTRGSKRPQQQPRNSDQPGKEPNTKQPGEARDKKKPQNNEQTKSSASATPKSQPVATAKGAENPKPTKVPKVCYAYNQLGHCKKPSCPHLHICLNFVQQKCEKRGECPLEHNMLKGDHNVDLLRSCQLLGRSVKELQEQLRALYSSAEAAGATAAPAAAQKKALPSFAASLVCSICTELFVRATTLACSHTFCEDCVHRVAVSDGACPLCRAAITSRTRSRAIDDSVLAVLETLPPEEQKRRAQVVSRRGNITGNPPPPPPAAGRGRGRGTQPGNRGRNKSRGPPKNQQQLQTVTTVVTTTTTVQKEKK